MWVLAEDWEGMAEMVKDFLIESLNDSADLHELRYHFDKYCQYKTNAAFERNGGNVSNEKFKDEDENEFGGHCGPKGYWRREEPDVVSPEGVIQINIMISKKAIKETIDMEEDELNEWIEKRKNGSWIDKFKATYIENYHPVKIKWDQLKKVNDD